MLTATDNEIARKILAKKMPSYRKAYSDRMAWLMAYMSELAYLKFDKPDLNQEVTLKLVERALKRVRKGTAAKIIGAIQQHYGYDHEAERNKLARSLEQVGWTLAETISVNATQAFVAYNDDYAVLAFRGTEADRIGDIKADAKATQTTCPTGGRVHSGFQGQYDDVETVVENALDQDNIKGKPLFITGHSLGGAVATIATRRLNETRQIAACYTYGSPRVGTEHWVGQIKSPVYRIVNSADPVPMVPLNGTTIAALAKGFRVLGRTVPLLRCAVWLGDWIERTMRGYTHTGNMRFLTNCKDGDFSKTELLYAVGWSRRVRGLVNGSKPWGKVLSDHGIKIYRQKMLHVADKRNP